ncbi:MAG: type VI secretion system protein, partial [Terracidiphilus sp.]
MVAVSDGFFAPAHSDQDSDKRWLDFVNRLKRCRRHRPVDGLILDLPASLLAGPDALSAADVLTRASTTASRLRSLRDELGFCFPVYLAVSGCEAVPGFAAFVQAQDDPEFRQIFGWSSPREPEAAFAPEWTAEAFAEMRRVLAAMRLEQFAQPGSSTNVSEATRDAWFLFPGNMQALETPVAAFLNGIFVELGHRGAVQFRGIYFSAHLTDSTKSPECAAQIQENPQPRFTLDLLEKKIVPERVLARPIDRVFARSAAISAVASAGCAVAALVLGFGTLIGWEHLSRTSTRTLPELQQIAQALSTESVTANDPSALAAIDAAQTLSGSNFRSVFLPLSWARPLDPKVRQVMPPVFTQLVYPAVRTGLEQKVANLVETPAPSATSPQSLSGFTDALLKLEDNVLLYNSLAPAGKGDGKGLLTLAGYLDPQSGSGIGEPSKFNAAIRWVNAKIVAPIFSGDHAGLDAIVRDSSGQPLDGRPWNKPTTDRLASMIADPNLEGTHLLDTLNTASDGIDRLSDPAGDSFQHPVRLEALNATLDQLQSQSQSAAAWFASTGPPTNIDQALQPIFSRPPLTNILLCDSTAEPNPCADVQNIKLAIQSAAASDFDALRRAIEEKQTATTGPLLDTSSKLQISQPTAKLQLALGGYLKLPFVTQEGNTQLR